MAVKYGIDYPFRDSTKGDYIKMTETPEREVRANLLHLLLTKKGTRYYLPDFGTRIYEFIFEPLDGATFESIRSEIEEQVAKYIPNLTINSITIEPYTESGDVVGQLDYELLGQASIFRIPGANTAEYTAKLKIDYTDENKAFGSREFIIINI